MTYDQLLLIYMNRASVTVETPPLINNPPGLLGKSVIEIELGTPGKLTTRRSILISWVK